INQAFLKEEQQILPNMNKIAHIPGVIVQGRLDMICPPSSAWAVHRAWPSSELKMVPFAGHAVSEPGIASELVQVMDKLARQRATLGV
ncbi:MAG: prolyl aminopeptidase, partial [Maritimibacter sp.]